MANHYVHFNITDVVYYGLLLYEQSTIHTIFTYGYYDDKRKDIVHLLHCHVNAFITKEKWQTVLRPFQYVGRMALTNYISHTIVTLLVFGLLFKNDYLAPLWVEYYSASVSTRYKSLLAAGGFHITNTGHLSTFGVLVLTGK